jgi:O-methyltransferase involved in polyketide biosynthesis
MRIKPELAGVPETALWTLWFRSLAARGSKPLLHDPMAIEVVEKIDYPFAEKFGANFPVHAQIQAVRVRTFDREVKGFPSVVALGEGLETEFWRVDDGRVRWLTVDLPESVKLRETLLPHHERMRSFAGSALDPGWMDLVEPGERVVITAQGLLMYLQPNEVHDLLARCARRFPGGSMVFDAVPPWMAGVIRQGTIGFKPPPLPWTLDPARLQELKQIDPAIAAVHDVRPVRGKGFAGSLAPVVRYLPLLRRQRPLIVRLDFATLPR